VVNKYQDMKNNLQRAPRTDSTSEQLLVLLVRERRREGREEGEKKERRENGRDKSGKN
jgi:hypothetical protein